MPKDIKDGTVAVCSACEKMCAAAVECECVFRIKDPDQKKKFRRSFPRKEYGISELVKRNQDYIKLHAEVERMRAVVSRLGEWVHEFGAALCPRAGAADTYGNGMRWAKNEVATILAALDAAKETGKELGE